MARRAETFAGRQRPEMFTAQEFAAAGFFLPKQGRKRNVDEVRVTCWYCGLELDAWEDWDVLEVEHLRRTRKWKCNAGGCKRALFCPGSTSV